LAAGAAAQSPRRLFFAAPFPARNGKTLDASGDLMGKPNYSFAKHQREIAKKKKKEAKLQRKAEQQQLKSAAVEPVAPPPPPAPTP